MFFNRDWKVGAAFDSSVIGDDGGFGALDNANARNDSRGRRFIAVHTICRKRAELKKGRVRIDDRFNPLADEHLAALFVAGGGGAPHPLFFLFWALLHVAAP